MTDREDNFVVAREVHEERGTSLAKALVWAMAAFLSVHLLLAPSWQEALVNLLIGLIFGVVVVGALFLLLAFIAKPKGWKRP